MTHQPTTKRSPNKKRRKRRGTPGPIRTSSLNTPDQAIEDFKRRQKLIELKRSAQTTTKRNQPNDSLGAFMRLLKRLRP